LLHSSPSSDFGAAKIKTAKRAVSGKRKKDGSWWVQKYIASSCHWEQAALQVPLKGEVNEHLCERLALFTSLSFAGGRREQATNNVQSYLAHYCM